MENIPFYIFFVFGLTTAGGGFLFYKATNYSKAFLIVALCWLAFQSFLSLSGFYLITDAFPPRFPLLVMPTIILMLFLFCTEKGKTFIDSLDIKRLTLFSIIRIPVEFVLFWLFAYKAVPEIMTFEGRNFDILSGISAPIVYYFAFVSQNLNRKLLLAWNFICLGLLLNVVVNALLSVPGTLQQFAFDQPNVAILYFPFALLPSFLVPLVLFSHLASIRQIFIEKN
ncbi:hypothetical protein [Flavobacterium noncentrifugens]|uniref:Uncharacterized protein n=1 Tax=Flavobacterium noncentrifugens TaxID=1128970 RepID=A0A1G8YE04_9FLAO|nr:hypothetical protein [Flavobacterium noncentrifugens]SDK00280.1 hypothetical protein SAMN04487935_2269 [Flavobacterium noncentrifugens]